MNKDTALMLALEFLEEQEDAIDDTGCGDPECDECAYMYQLRGIIEVLHAVLDKNGLN